MEVIATCIEGLEAITQLEIKELIKQKSEITIPSRIKFVVKTDQDLVNFIYNTRSFLKVYKLISHFQFSNLEDIISKAKKVKFPKILSPFVVRCERSGGHDFNSLDIEKEIGDIINKNGKLKVDLKNPITIIIVDIVNDHCFLGIDYTGTKLSKRQYRIKLIPNSINSCLAYCMLRFAELKDKDVILDPFCKSGEIPIEAVMYLLNIPPQQKTFEKLAFNKLIKFKPKNKIKNKKLNIYAIEDSQNSLRSAEINAKIANVNKSITFSRYNIEWLDTKFKKSTINKVITYPMFPTNTIPKDKAEKIYKELFYQSEYVLKSKGTVTVLTPAPNLIEKYAIANKFKKEKEIKIKYINIDYFIMTFKKAF